MLAVRVVFMSTKAEQAARNSHLSPHCKVGKPHRGIKVSRK